MQPLAQQVADGAMRGRRHTDAPAAAPTTPAVAEKAKQEEEPQALGAVTVRGRKRAPLELLKDVPLSQSVVSGADLDRELAQDLYSITKRGASISFNQNNTRGASLSIRGLGKRSFTETQDPSVLVISDGVSYGLTQLANFDFYDIDSVNVTRGPQGTLGGKGASTGIVTVSSVRPSFTPSADYQLTYGQRNAVIAQSNFGGAVIDDLLAWRGSFIVDNQRGFYDQAYDTNYSFYNKNRLSGRTQFLLTPSPDFTALLSVDVQPKAPQLENGPGIHGTDSRACDAPNPTQHRRLPALCRCSRAHLWRGQSLQAGSVYEHCQRLGAGRRRLVHKRRPPSDDGGLLMGSKARACACY